MKVQYCSLIPRHLCLLWMRMRIVHGQPFGQGSVVEGLVGGNQGNGAGAACLMEAVDFESHGELHGVVGAKRMLHPQTCGIIQKGGRELGDGIPPGEVLAETVEDRRGSPRRNGVSFAAAGDGARDFDGGDAGDVDHGGRVAARNAANPGGADFLDVAFDQALESTK